MIKRLLFVVRHGESSSGRLSNVGINQMRNLRDVIDSFISRAFGDRYRDVIRLFFSFSNTERALESSKLLNFRGDDVVITNQQITDCRTEIYEPRLILAKVTGIADIYGAQAVIIVTHGMMPAVLAETAHESVTGKMIDLPSVKVACGYAINMADGEITLIGHDSSEEKPKQVVGQKRNPETVATVIVEKPRESRDTTSSQQNLFDGGLDDDVPF